MSERCHNASNMTQSCLKKAKERRTTENASSFSRAYTPKGVFRFTMRSIYLALLGAQPLVNSPLDL